MNPYHKVKGKEGGRFTSPGNLGGEPTDKAMLAKLAHHMVGKAIQNYATGNEAELAKALGGDSLPDNEPIDVAVKDATGRIKHGIEVKTIVSNKAGKITMNSEALSRKRSWARRNQAVFHTVVLDDSKVYSSGDKSLRIIYYRRGAGSFRITKMYQVKNYSELKTLLVMETRKLPTGAK